MKTASFGFLIQVPLKTLQKLSILISMTYINLYLGSLIWTLLLGLRPFKPGKNVEVYHRIIKTSFTSRVQKKSNLPLHFECSIKDCQCCFPHGSILSTIFLISDDCFGAQRRKSILTLQKCHFKTFSRCQL